MRLRSLVKTTAIPALHHIGAIRALDRCVSSSAPVVLSYHCVAPATFEAHARYLARYCHVVDPMDLTGTPSTSSGKDRRRVVLTFDDGYASFAHEIVPILERHGLPAAWFVVTDVVGSQDGFWFDRVQSAIETTEASDISLAGRTWSLPSHGREYVAYEIKSHMKSVESARLAELVEELLRQTGACATGDLRGRRLADADEIRTVMGHGVRVGSHSKTHRNLSSLSDAELDRELYGSKEDLEILLGEEVACIAFPSGDHDDRVVARVSDAGYRLAFTTEPRFVGADDLPHRVPRIIIDDHASVAILAARISTWMHRKGAIR